MILGLDISSSSITGITVSGRERLDSFIAMHVDTRKEKGLIFKKAKMSRRSTFQFKLPMSLR